MGEKEKIETFYLDIKARSNMDQCPFLVEWFNAKLEEIDKLPDEHGRSGIAKGDRLPIPKAKRLLALHDVVFKKLRLKDFCKLKQINHGTARNWRNTDEIFKELALGFAEEFSHAFLRRYSELVEPRPANGFVKALDLIRECRHYPAATVEQIKIRLEHYSRQKRDGADPEAGPLDNLNLVNNILFSIILISQTDKDADRRKYGQTLCEQVEQHYYESLIKLCENKSAKEKAAIELAGTMAYQTIAYFAVIINEFID